MEPWNEISQWSRRPVVGVGASNGHAMTVDVEDYFQVEAFTGAVDRAHWDTLECRVERNVDRVLEIFAEAQVSATFFTLGWIAQRYPTLVRRIVGAGHELASHGLEHQRADNQTGERFLADVKRTKAVLEDCSGAAVKGYRAASFSIGPQNLWAFEALHEVGYRYSSSVYPIKHDRYGIPDAPRVAFHPLAGCKFVEIPLTTVRRYQVNWPCGGGGYFRLLPYSLSVGNMRAASVRNGQPCVFYFHPWEIDPDQPRISKASFSAQFRHYLNLGKMEARLRRLVTEFKWNRIDRIYPLAAA
jgi:polysaccharide deacetylase family protein (PEP-CTERM system associated)